METIRYIPFALAPDADRYNLNPETDRVRVPSGGYAEFLVIEGAGGTGTAAITVNEHTAATAGSSNSGISFRYKTVTAGADFDDSGGFTTATTVTPAAGATKCTIVQVRSDELSAGFNFISVKLTEGVDSPVDAAVVGVIRNPDRTGSATSYLA